MVFTSYLLRFCYYCKSVFSCSALSRGKNDCVCWTSCSIMSSHTLQSHSLTKFNINKLYEHRLCATAAVFYYIGKSVLVENRPLIKFTRNYIRDLSGVFSISSLVRISMTSFPALALLFLQKHSCPCNKKKITRWLEGINFIFSW